MGGGRCQTCRGRSIMDLSAVWKGCDGVDDDDMPISDYGFE